MKKHYVRLKSDVTIAMNVFIELGYEVLRVRTTCNCHANNNRRNGIIVIDGDRIDTKILRCKACAGKNKGNDSGN